MSLGTDLRLALEAPQWALLLPALLLLHLLLRRRGSGLGLGRMALLGCLVLALTRPVLGGARSPGRLLLVDRSESVAGEALREHLDRLPAEVGLLKLPWGDDVASPLAATIERASVAYPDAGHWIILSDGRSTDSGAREAAMRAAQSVRIDVLPVAAASTGPDAAVVAIDVPAAWRAGQVAWVEIHSRAADGADYALELDAGGVGIARRDLVGAAEEQVTWFPLKVPLVEEPLVVEARARLPGDVRPENDALRTAVEVEPPPEVLIVGEGPEPVRLADRLGSQAGFATTVLGPRRLPGRLSALARWPAIVLVDVPASALAHEQQALLEAAVADGGQGLLLMGGRSSFVLGGWRGTALEDLAPVRLETAPSGLRREVSLLLLVDGSASMAGGDSRSRASKLDLAREAGLLAAEVLSPQDRIGAVIYDDEARWLAELGAVGQAGDRQELRRALGRVIPDGGTRILSALELGLPALAAESAVTRHAVLLSDGRDDHGEEALLTAAVRAARDQGVTLSAIAIGLDADAELLQRLARLGGGRFHAARDPGDLPRLTAEESEMVRAGAERQGTVRARRPSAALAHPILADADIAALPTLGGYQALLPRKGAAVALEADEGDPLLATWTYGRGRVAAWTSDSGADWATSWLDAPEGGAMWAQAIHHLAPATDEGPLTVSVELLEGGRVARVQARLSTREGAPRSLADVALRIEEPRLGVPEHSLDEVAPGLYRRDLALGDPAAGPLVWRGEVRVGLPSPPPEPAGEEVPESVFRAALRIDRGHAPETLPPVDGAALLAELAAAGGGQVLEAVPEEWLRPRRPERPLWTWLLALAAVAWPIDLALRLRRPEAALDPSATVESNAPQRRGAPR